MINSIKSTLTIINVNSGQYVHYGIKNDYPFSAIFISPHWGIAPRAKPRGTYIHQILVSASLDEQFQPRCVLRAKPRSLPLHHSQKLSFSGFYDFRRRKINRLRNILHFLAINANSTTLNESACFAFGGDHAGMCHHIHDEWIIA